MAFLMSMSSLSGRKSTSPKASTVEHPITQFKHSGVKRNVSYDWVHEAAGRCAGQVKEKFMPECILAIGSGGLVPARILRTHLPGIPLVVVSVNLYNESTEEVNTEPVVLQWVDEATTEGYLRGKRVLVVDDIDDSRSTLAAVLKKLQDCQPAKCGVCVLYLKENSDKVMEFDESEIPFFFGGKVGARTWVEFPWEVEDLDAHNRLARQQE